MQLGFTGFGNAGYLSCKDIKSKGIEGIFVFDTLLIDAPLEQTMPI
ncbi:hypothetical protein KHM83_05815 [Fusibacter paucivorans]|uniref:Uncharacterized protein n=1 Tax=Fusibacter paucivorans TaxID=76009 RepID=A0ABS5PLX7_9FIRM|nr:hypothetical protein [Fusibacter paucivorans]MBS7526185.1 hypothetical protein [Fusibacter paucivorans]